MNFRKVLILQIFKIHYRSNVYRPIESLNLKHIFSKFHTSSRVVLEFKDKVLKDVYPTKKELAPREQIFGEIQVKNKEFFLKVIKAFKVEDRLKRGHIELIYAALKQMKEFGVETDLESYKTLMEVFPKGKMIAKNLIQAEFSHFARHQDCGTFLLDQMEYNGVFPDRELGQIILSIFGVSSYVYKKYARMMYWMPKLKNLNPYLMPDPMPKDIQELAILALKKMSVDPRTKIVAYDAKDLEDSVDKTWIMSAQSILQERLIKSHPIEKPIFVEGPYLVWLRKLSMTYYVLRADPKIYPNIEIDEDDVSNLCLWMFGDKKPKELTLRPSSVHEQEEGIILGMCCTGTSSKDSLLSWIRFLTKSNPKLDKIPVLFTLQSPPKSVVPVNAAYKSEEKKDSPEASATESAL